jgi:hypothetical protein
VSIVEVPGLLPEVAGGYHCSSDAVTPAALACCLGSVGQPVFPAVYSCLSLSSADPCGARPT